MLPSRALTAALCLLPLAACTPVDNSGGDPPAGDSMEFALVGSPAGFCEAMDEAALIGVQADIEDWVEGCDFADDMRADLETAHGALEAEQALVIVSAQLGGCLGDFEVVGVYEDGDQLNVWMLKEDTAYGKTNVACNDDLGEGHALIVVEDAADALSVSLTVGIWNPQLPGGPASIVGEDQ